MPPSETPALSARSRAALGLLLLLCLAGSALVMRSTRRDGRPPDARTARARRELLVLGTALDRYRTTCGDYPSTAEGLKALVANPGRFRWAGPYVSLLQPDPWGRPYRYAYATGIVTLLSLGPDGGAGTPDDLPAPHFAAPARSAAPATNALPERLVEGQDRQQQ